MAVTGLRIMGPSSRAGTGVFIIPWDSIADKPVSFPPSAHSHPQSDVTNLVSDLAAKEPAIFNGDPSYYWAGDKQWKPLPTSIASDWEDIANKPIYFPPEEHTHPQSDVTNLVTDLSNKAALVHTHPQSDIDGLVFDLFGKAPTVHTHEQVDITGLVAALDGKEPTIAVGTTAQYWRGDKTWQTLPASGGSDTAAEILTKLLTVDGTGSLLDADFLDGQSGAHYLAYANLTGVPSTFPATPHIHAAIAVTFSPAGNIAATNVQAAIVELDAEKESAANKGAINGYAGLDSAGKVPLAQLPASIDDVFEYGDFASLPAVGAGKTIYITRVDGKIYYWTGTDYVELAASGGGSGDVVGPASSVADRIVLFSGTTGKLIKDGGVLLSAYVPATRTVTAGSGLSGGGDLTSNITLNVGAGVGIVGTADSIALDVPVSIINGGTGAITAGAALTNLGAEPALPTGGTNLQFLRGDKTFTSVGMGAVVGTISSTQHGPQSTASLHAIATTIANGFMSSTDKTKLDAFSSAASYLLLAGGTMTGKIALAPAVAGYASINVPVGVAPTTPVVGDMWTVGQDLFYRRNSTTGRVLNELVGAVIKAYWTFQDYAQFDKSIYITASTTTEAGFYMSPYGVAPSSPTDGEIWALTNDIFIQLNGVTNRMSYTGGKIHSGTTAPSSPAAGDVWIDTT